MRGGGARGRGSLDEGRVQQERGREAVGEDDGGGAGHTRQEQRERERQAEAGAGVEQAEQEEGACVELEVG